MGSSNAVIKLLVAMVWCVVSVGCVAEESAKQSSKTDKIKSINRIDLDKSRPANSFVMVESKNDAVCSKFLSAINEEGYNSKYYSPEIDAIQINSVTPNMDTPERLIQTRFNVPRKLIPIERGEREIRDEEYALDIDGNSKNRYAYRSTYGMHDAYIQDFDFMDESFFTQDKDKLYIDYFKRIRDSGKVSKIKVDWKLIGDDKLGKAADEIGIETRVQQGIIELIVIDNTYYLARTKPVIKDGEPIKVILLSLDKNYLALPQCLLQSNFIVNNR